jgi:hypothetical protein
MTRLRLAAIAALSLVALLATTTGGEAQGQGDVDAQGSCDERHPGNKDFFDSTVKAKKQQRRGGAGAAAFRPLVGAKVIVKLVDLTSQNGNNVVGKARKSDRTNADGIAKTTHQFDNFGNYRLKIKVKSGGEVVARDRIDVGVSDRVDGKCGPPLMGPP